MGPQCNVLVGSVETDFPVEESEDAEFEDPLGIGGECWRGTVSVELDDRALGPLSLNQEGVDLGGTSTFSGGFLRIPSE